MSETVVFSQHQKLLPPMELVWTAGPERGKRFLLSGGRQTFGRSGDNHLVLSDDTVSSHHGVLVYVEEGEVLFYDTASRNGISRDGKKAPIIPLKTGQQIQIGAVYLKLVPAGQPLDAPPPARRKIRIPWREKRVWVPAASAVFFLFTLAVRPSFSVKEVQTSAPSIGVEHAVQARSLRAARPKTALKRRPTRTSRETDAVTEVKGPADDPLNAGRLYEEALMMKGSSPDMSREKLEMALAVSDPASEIHARAKELLEAGGSAK